MGEWSTGGSCRRRRHSREKEHSEYESFDEIGENRRFLREIMREKWPQKRGKVRKQGQKEQANWQMTVDSSKMEGEGSILKICHIGFCKMKSLLKWASTMVLEIHQSQGAAHRRRIMSSQLLLWIFLISFFQCLNYQFILARGRGGLNLDSVKICQCQF